jgi:hypothetical protein
MHSFLQGKTRKMVRSFAIQTVWLALAASVMLTVMQPVNANAAGLTGAVTTLSSSVTVRAAANSSAKAVTVIKKGDVVKIQASSGLWSKISTSGGLSGWCESKYLTTAVYTTSVKRGNTASLDWPSDYIDVTKSFSYQRCVQDMKEIAAAYPSLARIVTIGKSTFGNNINAIVLGSPNADKRILVQAEIHSREWLTSLVVLRQAECILKDATMNASYKGLKIANMLNDVEIWVVPQLNPDGLRLVFEGLASVPASMPQMAASIKSMNSGSNDFSRWKANGRGVDLNRNFDSYWKIDPEYPKPGPFNYAGPKPFSEAESIALRDLTLAKDFDMTISYHSSGDMIYWYDPSGGQNNLNLYIANDIKSLTGYTILTKAAQAPSNGYRDWFDKTFHQPGFTIEIGSSYCPLPMSSFNGCWQDNRFVMLEMAWTVAPKSLTVVAR